MIDAKKYEELVSKGAELNAEVRVCQAMYEFAIANAEKCRRERIFVELDAWLKVADSVNAKKEVIHTEYEDLVKQLKTMRGMSS